MDFARKQLEKYGWSDGKGLGKNEDGISQALKPKLKRSVAGIGHDAAADFTEHWWSELYNKAAKNVEVEEKNGKTKKIKTKDTEEFEITNSTWKLKKKHNKKKDDKQYAEFFVKKAVLDSGGVKMETVSDSDSENEDKKDVFKMTDEELFAACEGRTAHKGARHGLKATGKLARIAQQEQMLLSQPQYNGYSHFKNAAKEKVSITELQVVEEVSLNSDGDITVKKKKKKKRKHCISQSDINEEDLVAEQAMPLPEFVKKLNVEEGVASENNDEHSRKNKKSKKKSINIDDGIDFDAIIEKECKEIMSSDLVCCMDIDDVEKPVKSKKTKKNKLKSL